MVMVTIVNLFLIKNIKIITKGVLFMSNALNVVIGNKIQTAEEAVRIANEVERLEAVIKVLKDQMKVYVDQNGPIETDTVVWDYNVSNSFSFDAEGLKRVAENIVLEGKNPWELMSISAANLKKLGWEDSYIETLGKKKQTIRFNSRKK